MRKFLFFFLIFLASCQKEVIELSTVEHVRCATDMDVDSLFGYPNRRYLEDRKMGIRNLSTQLKSTPFPSGMTVPVIFHIVHSEASGAQTNSNILDARIIEQMKSLNDDFSMSNADTSFTPSAFKYLRGNPRIQFCLATKDPNGNTLSTPGINRKYCATTSWSATGAMKLASYGGVDTWGNKYMNVWVCNLGGALGYAIYPVYGNPQSDGIVLSYKAVGKSTYSAYYNKYDKGRTLTHEVGHWLGLWHLGGWGCGDDLIGDTPLQQFQNYNCQPFPKISCNNAPNGEMWMNYMDNTYDPCLNMFTKEQCEIMTKHLFGYRRPLMYSLGCK